MRCLLRAWKGYWFHETPLVNLAVSRILIVAIQLRWLVQQTYEYSASQPASLYDPLPILHVLLLPVGWNFQPDLAFLEAVHYVTLGAGFLALVGLFTNFSLVLFAAGNILLQAHEFSFGNFHHPEAPFMIALMILALSPAGGALSIDDLWRRLRRNARCLRFEPARLLERTSPFAGWPLRLIQWILALIYLSAAYSKLNHGGLDWANGYTLRYYLVQDGLRWGSEIGLWFSNQHVLAQVLSWFTLLVEGTFFLTVLLPPLAWFYLPAAAALHLGIEVTLKAPFFHWVVLYSVFIPWSRVFGKAGHLLKRRGQEPSEVYFDDSCLLCVRSMTVLDYLDWGRRLRFRDIEHEEGARNPTRPDLLSGNLLEEMHVIGPDGEVRRGFFAFRHVAARLPLLWPFALLAHLPLADRVGPGVYATIARTRSRVIGCGGSACGAHCRAAT